ncbi:MAG: hypothetical protein AAF390_09660 [Pseudomonadota bacterium]
MPSFETNETLKRLFQRFYREELGNLSAEERAAFERQFEARFQTLLEGEDDQSFAFPDIIGFGSDGVKDWGDLPYYRIKPDFDAAIIPSQLHAAAELYYIYQHERMKVFEVVDALRKLFQLGRLRIQQGPGARGLYILEKWKPLRYTKRDRMIAYKRAFNYGGGPIPAGAVVNKNFHYQFVAFMSSLAQYTRDLTVSEVIKGSQQINDRPFGNIASIQRLGTDLRYALDRASYGNILALTHEVGQYLRTALDLFEAPDIMKSFDANNKWDVIEQVSQRHLKGQTPLSQRSKMAEAGRRALEFVASNDFETNVEIEVFRSEIRPIAAYAEAWIAAYRLTAEGRRFPGVSDQLRWSVGLPHGKRATA